MPKTEHFREFRKGYLKLDVIKHDSEGHDTHEKGGWIDDPEHGRLTAAVCSCGNTAVGWSVAEATANLDCESA
jgi:hypothetical protein